MRYTILAVEAIDPAGGDIDIFLDGDATAVVDGLVEGDSILITTDPLTQIVIGISNANTTVIVLIISWYY
ncbi:hypothetical protein [Wukongibacter sp. M2B1]|uniref:hypothetical protein n=1 Tax=Wukongibacter sp. M2B1 TaxID=3088895 RepID=UPI003D78BEC4